MGTGWNAMFTQSGLNVEQLHEQLFPIGMVSLRDELKWFWYGKGGSAYRIGLCCATVQQVLECSRAGWVKAIMPYYCSSHTKLCMRLLDIRYCNFSRVLSWSITGLFLLSTMSPVPLFNLPWNLVWLVSLEHFLMRFRGGWVLLLKLGILIQDLTHFSGTMHVEKYIKRKLNWTELKTT